MVRHLGSGGAMQQPGSNKIPQPPMETCRGCGLLKPVRGLGSDGRCLDCRLAPILTYEPPLSVTQRRRKAGLPRWSGPYPNDGG
jgi:hypothetical protein